MLGPMTGGGETRGGQLPSVDACGSHLERLRRIQDV